MIAGVLDSRLQQLEVDLNEKLQQERAAYMNALDGFRHEFEEKLHNIVLYFVQVTEDVGAECSASSKMVKDIIQLAAGSQSARKSLAPAGENPSSPNLLGTPSMSWRPLPTARMVTQEYMLGLEQRIVALEMLLENRPIRAKDPDNTAKSFVQLVGSFPPREPVSRAQHDERNEQAGTFPEDRTDTHYAQAKHDQKQKKHDKHVYAQSTKRVYC